jgi:signal transduction histidine kinase/CheY-like chemotaxis protein
MSRNKITKRLDEFFADFNPNEESVDIPSMDASENPIFSWETDPNGLFTICDESILQVLGVNPDQALGNPIESFQLPAKEQIKIRSVLQDDQFPIEIELNAKTADKKKHMVRYTIYHKLDEDGQKIGFRGYCELIKTAKSPIKRKTRKPKQTPISSLQTSPLDEQNGISSPIDTSDLSNIQLDTSPLPPQDKFSIGDGVKKKSTKKRKTGFNEDVIKQMKEIDQAEPGESKTLTLLRETTETDDLSTSMPVNTKALSGISLIKNQCEISSTVWTAQAQASFEDNKLIAIPTINNAPAILAVPLKLRNEKKGVIEIIDDKKKRVWTDEDRIFLQEVSNQLGLALENSQLYSTIQKELSERVKAERETLRRNNDLSNLNLIGQQLSHLVSQQQIFDMIAPLVQKLMNVENVLLTLVNKEKTQLTFPVCVVNGINNNLSPRDLQQGYQETILMEQKPLLLNRNLSASLSESKIDHSTSLPYSLLAVPLLTSDRATGVLSVFDYHNEDAFDQVQVELLSSVAAQVATALENANLFKEISNALQFIENRQRIQSNITDAVTELSLKGSKEINTFLKSLALASLCERAVYAQIFTKSDQEQTWQTVASYISPDSDLSEVDSLYPHDTIDQLETAIIDLENKGWHSRNIFTASEQEKNWMLSNSIQSILILAVKRDNKLDGFITLEKHTSAEDWKNEEIDILRTASEAFSNMLIREDLLEQLRSSLSETENLYSASHQLALASNMQDMILAVISSFSASEVNRGEIMLFDYNMEGRISRMKVFTNYSDDSSLASNEPGYEYPVDLYESIFSSISPVFFDNLSEAPISESLKANFLAQGIQSMAILPMWSGNVQTGVLLLQTNKLHHFSTLEKRSYPPLVDQMSTGIQNQRLFESTQIALAETELLYRISSGIAKSSSMEELISLVGENAMPKNCESLQLYVISDAQSSQSPDFSLVGTYSTGDEPGSASPKIPASALPFLEFPTSDPILLSNILDADLPVISQTFFRNAGISSAIIIPLQTATNPVGFMLASSKKGGQFDPKDAHTIQIIGNSIAVAIERQRLLFEAQRRALELQTAAEIARDTTSTLSQDILLSRIVNLLKDRFGYYHCSIFLLDESNQFAIIEESTGEAGKEMKQNKHKLAVGSKSVIGSCLASGMPIIVNDSTLSPIYYPNPLLPDTRSEMGIPLKIGGHIIGALDLHSTSTNAFSENELTVLQILTDQISVAIENARAFSISQKAVQEMRELDRVKSQFLANMSHELRTPLNSVIGFSRVILKGIDGPINKVQEQDITSIYNSGMNLLNMINEILDLSKIEAGKMELQLEDVSIAEVITKAISTVMGLIKDKPIELIQKIPTDLPIVKADEIKLGQVVLNLLSNAIKFTEKGTITIKAELIKDANLNPEIKVSVSDSGVGISSADQAKLFQRFSQVDDSPTRKTGGTGLGLSISRSLIEMHGGKIGLLSSEPGKGSVFYFTLPVLGYHKGLDMSHLGHGENVILSIDDDPQVIGLYERYLKNYGFEVVALTNPSKAVEKAVELKPFAITLDIMMPQVDGWQVLHELKQDERTRDIPILVCSILEDEEKGYSLGASEYLVKPFLQDDLINAIHRINREGYAMEVLIIDDDVNDLKFVKKMVETEPRIHPTLAQGGKIALEILNNLTPDLIVLDLFMPDMNGFEILEKIKSEPRLSKIPVIVLTGADLTPEQKAQLAESSQSLTTQGLIKESDILKNMEEALQKIKPLTKEKKGNTT